MFDTYVKNKIFIVDNDNINLKLFDCYLKDFNDIEIYKFNKCNDFLENLELRPSIVLLNNEFKGIDISGCDLLKIIKEFDKDIQVILMSDKIDEKAVCETTLAGSNGFLIKDKLILEKVREKVSDSLSIFSLVKKYKKSKMIRRNMCYFILFLLSIIISYSIHILLTN